MNTSRRIKKGLSFIADIGTALLRSQRSRKDLIHSAVLKRLVRSLAQAERLEEDPQDETELLRIGDIEFWWPCEYSAVLLPTIWAEVFLPYPPNGHAYEAEGTSVPKGGWVVDIGAGEGFFIAYCLRRGANVLAVEPLPRLVHCLQKTFSQDIEQGRVILVKAFAGAGTRESSNLPKDEVPVITLDRILESLSLPSVDLIKVDVEGAETQVLDGARTVLSKFQPELSVCVYHYKHQEKEVSRFMSSMVPGYKIVAKGLRRTGASLVRQVLHASPKS